MAPEFSSNWKKLQSVLKQESKAIVDRKRKSVPTDQSRNSIAKRRRLEGASNKSTGGQVSEGGKRRKMGNGASSEQTKTAERTPSTSLALWAEDNDISARDLADAYGGDLNDTTIKSATKDKVNAGLCKDVDVGQYIGIDCEMVAVGGEEDRSVLARVSIVNFHGTQVYDSFVRPKELVTDWRTNVSGVSPKNMATAREFEEVQEEVAAILEGRVVVGHALKNDLDVLMMGHPKKDLRDTAKFPAFRKYSAGRQPALKKLAREILGVEIQEGEHSSIEDARTAMLLFRSHKSAFDVDHAARFPAQTSGAGAKPKPKKKKKKSKH